MYYVNKIIGWVMRPLGMFFLSLGLAWVMKRRKWHQIVTVSWAGKSRAGTM